jgi:hypothetical protein
MSFSESDPGGGRQPTEEELRAAYEAELKKIRVEQVLLEHVVTLVNLGMRKTGLAPGTESERDRAQVGLAIESVRAQLPLIEQVAPEHAKPIRDALSQLQMAFVRIGGEAGEEAESGAAGAGAPPEPGQPAGPPEGQGGADAPETGGPDQPGGQPQSEGPGPAQRSGRLWVPGQ